MENENILEGLEEILSSLEEDLQEIVNRKDELEARQEETDAEELKELEERQESLEKEIDELIEDKEKIDKILLEGANIERIIENHNERIKELEKNEEVPDKEKETKKLKRAITMNLGRLAKKRIAEGKILEKYKLLNEAEIELQKILRKYPDHTKDLVREYKEELEITDEEEEKIQEITESIEELQNDIEELQKNAEVSSEETIENPNNEKASQEFFDVPSEEIIEDSEVEEASQENVEEAPEKEKVQEDIEQPTENVNQDNDEGVEIKLDENPKNNVNIIDDAIEDINIDEESGRVTYSYKGGKEGFRVIDELMTLKNVTFNRMGIKTICEEIAGGKMKGWLLLRKVNPVIIDVLANNGEYIRKYIESLNSNSELPFKLNHSVARSSLKISDKIRMRRYARSEKKIPGTSIIFNKGKSRILDAGSSLKEFLPEENITDFKDSIKTENLAKPIDKIIIEHSEDKKIEHDDRD